MTESSNILQKSSPNNVLGNSGAPLGVLKGFDKLNNFLGTWFENVAIVAIVGIVISNLIDVIGAKLFNKPIAAGTEIVYFLQVIAIAGALTATKLDGKHIRIEFVDGIRGRLKYFFHLIVALLGLALFIVLFWKGIEYAMALKIKQDVTAVSRIALYPFVLWIAFCCIPLCLVILRDLYESVIGVMKG